MSTATIRYISTTSSSYTEQETALAATEGQPIATNISTGKKGFAGSIIAGAIIGGVVVVVLILAIFCGLRHRYRRSKGQTDSTMEANPENENENKKCADTSGSSHGPCLTPPAACPSTDARSDVTVCQAGSAPCSPSSPRKSIDSPQTYPAQANSHNITTLAPRPRCYKAQAIIHGLDPNSAPCMNCALSPPSTSRPTGADISTCSPGSCSSEEDYFAYNKRTCVPSTSPPLPPGAMPPLPSPTLESYGGEFKTLPPPQSPPPQSPSSPGGSLRRWIMSPLSRSGTVRTALPPYEQPASGQQQRASEKEKDERDLAAAVYTFM